ncbi:MAG: hypothetical protein HY821_23785 [Acidobacteria bacterium]|nr:hypothetical protein [Acidobacteriota bacterium]
MDGRAGATASHGFEAHSIETRRQGEEARSVTLPAISSSALQVFALRPGKPDFGTIVISSNVDDLQVKVDSYTIPFKVRNGMGLPRIPAGEHRVLVKRDDYEPLPPSTVTVKRGEDVILKLQLKPLDIPYTATGLSPGATLLVDGQAIEVGADGGVRGKLPPGAHIFELQKAGARSKPVSKFFTPGAPMALAAAELPLIQQTGTLVVEGTPPGATITARKDGEASARAIAGPASLPEGGYTVSAAAPGYAPAEAHTSIQAGRTSTVSLRMSPVAPRRDAAPAPPPQAPDSTVKSIPGWQESAGWLVKRGGGFSPAGTLRPNAPLSFQAALRDGKRLQWMITAGDRTFLLFKLERKKFIEVLSSAGKQRTLAEVNLDTDIKAGVTVKITLNGTKLTHTIGGATAEIDIPSEFAAGGPFGFMIPGGDEFALREFRGR